MLNSSLGNVLFFFLQSDVYLYEYCDNPIPYAYDVEVQNTWVEAFLDITYRRDGTPRSAEAVALPPFESNSTVTCKDSNASFWRDPYEQMCYTPTSYLSSLKGLPSYAKWFECSTDYDGAMTHFWYYDLDELACLFFSIFLTFSKKNAPFP